MPDTLMPILLDEKKKTDLFDKFMEVGESLDHDWFTEYYQDEQGDRKNLKQDFTPDSICRIATEVLENQGVIADICSGTGGLTLKEWQRGTKEFRLIEFAERAMPVLLFNLAIRNINAVVYNGDALSREVFKCYKLEQDEKYSTITLISTDMEFKVDNAIMNPPYSLKWEYEDFRKNEDRFKDYGMPPKSKSDYAFILDGLSRLNENGSLVAILPHGVLFRGSAEGKIRQKLIENNLIDMIIGLPDQMFLNTQIPTCIIRLKKNRDTMDIYFIDASKKCTKKGKLNYMEEEHIKEVLSAVELRKDIDKFAHVATLKEIQDNDYNLNIPRYVDVFEPPEPIDGVATMKELLNIEKDLKQAKKDILGMMDDMIGESDFDELRELWREYSEL